jgi:hypothetical protein
MLNGYDRISEWKKLSALNGYDRISEWKKLSAHGLVEVCVYSI